MKPTILALFALTLATPALSDPYLARCQMDECVYYDQSDRLVVGTGSAAVPGDLVEVTLRAAISSRPDIPAAELDWEDPSPVQFFCSTTRPAFKAGDGSYTALDLVTPVGATTMVTAMYLHACHPGRTGDADPFAAASALGYRATETGSYDSFAALVR